MTTTVNSAIEAFLQDVVNLDPDDSDGARTSRDWLIDRIRNFPEAHSDFPVLYDQKGIAFGSFARRTKIRPLDDVDLITCLSATGGTYDSDSTPFKITVPTTSRLSSFCHDNSQTLNSIKIINRFVKALASVPQYSSAKINRAGEAAVLNLKSRDWSFDVVPGFFTTEDTFGRTYYLIPDGGGHWKKTDPRKDRDRVVEVNQSHDGHVLNVVRTLKYWNKRPTMPSMPSYMLECMIVGLYAVRSQKATQWVDMEVGPALRHIATAVQNPVNDPKGIQGNLNALTWLQQNAIRDRALLDAGRADEARAFEKAGDHEEAIGKWREVFGPEFPES